MEFTLYSGVVMVRDMHEEGLYAGDISTIVERHDVAGKETGYSVEFFDMFGNTVTVATLPVSYLRVPTQADRPAVRSEAAMACQ